MRSKVKARPKKWFLIVGEATREFEVLVEAESKEAAAQHVLSGELDYENHAIGGYSVKILVWPKKAYEPRVKGL